MFCKICGATLPDGTKFCTKCGSKIVDEPAFNAPQQQIAPQQQQFASQQPVNPVAYGGQAPAPKKSSLMKIIIPIVAVLVIAGLAVGAYFLFFADKKGGGEGEGNSSASSYEQVAMNYYKAMENGDGSTLQSCYSYQVSLLKAQGKSDDYIKEQYNLMAKEKQQTLHDAYGKGCKVKYEIKEAEKVDEDELKEAQDMVNEMIKDQGINMEEAKFSAGYELVVEVTIEGDEKDYTYTEDLAVAKINDKWTLM